MPLYWFLVVVVSLGSAAISLPDPLPNGIAIMLGAIVLVTALIKACGLATVVRLLRGERNFHDAVCRFDRQLHLIRWIWLPLATVLFLATDFAALDRWGGWFESSITIRAFVLLLPSLAVGMATWWTEAEVFSIVDQGDSDARVLAVETINDLRTQAGWLLMPLGLILLAIDAANAFFGNGTWQSHSAVAVMLLLIVALGLSPIVRCLWRTSPVDHLWVAEFPSQFGFRGTTVRLWHPPAPCATAMMVGFVPGFRTLLISETLLARLSPDQLRMVLLHELAHLRRWHIPARMLSAAPLVTVAAAAGWLALAPWSSVVVCGLALLTTLALLRFVAIQTEFAADRHACLLAASDSTPIRHAAELLGEALRLVCADSEAAQRGGWMHPCLEKRLSQLEQIEAPTTATSGTVALPCHHSQASVQI